MKNYFLDTNVILHDPSSVFRFPDGNVIILDTVMDEIDSKKGLFTEAGNNAREFFRFYTSIRNKIIENTDSDVIELEAGGTFQVLSNMSLDKGDLDYGYSKNDNIILSSIIKITRDNPSNEYVLVTNDGGLLAKADAVNRLFRKNGHKNFSVDIYDNDRLIETVDYIHRGYHEVFVDQDILNELYKNKFMDYTEFKKGIYQGEGMSNLKDVFVGDFFICKNAMKSEGQFTGRLVLHNEKKVIRKITTDGPIAVKNIEPRNIQQKMFLDLLLDTETKVVCCIGKAGTGKTLEAIAAGLYQIEELGIYKKMLVARPVVAMGKDIGYLPGEKEDKLKPWMQPIYDNLEYIFTQSNKGKGGVNVDEIVEGMNHLEIEALTYIRGRSIPDSFIIIDEAQNLTRHEIKTILTRAGKGTKVVLLGDPEQIDNQYLDSINNGLTFATERMKNQPIAGIIRLEKTERSELAELAAELLK
ncbi:PhoH family protein [Bacillus sp. Brlt_9]|uniref:PhoH family protein n=1 Tax=Bacillus sp. Brlt_9 TaxID=3110916 RepID=UPI003F7B8FE0